MKTQICLAVLCMACALPSFAMDPNKNLYPNNTDISTGVQQEYGIAQDLFNTSNYNPQDVLAAMKVGQYDCTYYNQDKNRVNHVPFIVGESAFSDWGRTIVLLGEEVELDATNNDHGPTAQLDYAGQGEKVTFKVEMRLSRTKRLVAKVDTGFFDADQFIVCPVQ